MKCVVTGGAGFIGSHLADALVERGHEVHIIDNLHSGKKEHVHKDAVLHIIDIRDLEKIRKVFKDLGAVKCVFHLATLPRVPFSIEHPIETNAVNVDGALNMLVASKDAGAEKFVYSASSSAYGDQNTLPLTEDMRVNPKSPYGLQKYIGELYCKIFYEVYGLPTVSLRYFNVYGPRYNPEGDYALVIGKFIKQKRQGKPLTITGDGSQTRDFTHVSDVVQANILAMESDKVGKGDVINIGGGSNTSINALASLIGGPVQYIEARLESKDTLADIKKAKELLGWEPKMQFEEGIRTLLRNTA
ncbi:MAG: hypothetical protein A3C80_01455 [Candidatus Ryanbacteria bacterium RIFCSPHIGHO2_02_FULL_45_43]|uniref:NAD-dependent epimerase/dehydratase domain-containing protein n=1 Tax=Candidatus Ryanbacteria bacterium RIFCSPHIGHO2_01_45_13 TaxID=1802112 RepID=A0A1G2FVY3_9BACT|nr:MAG: hypothetical protein A2W41_00880 [Candidatus Ryanbacteria bacterium RIFCSPHIGHO2_01_45_13]OGZ42359.1 MAG: hypothetical protein A2718_02230 [Candidatus Ryanbacteria bacterium RIFCSPHIGHO2_01_FULL_44_130]OGZ48344.1 MAG: hypothetical protein A3C80_01455 [Candidatus Ryanbacteria bacterium RIFCSPHIGHO2_02_FULL_45_43]OGZ50454.1 MAG: hypothetical protein A3E55_03635 [Candidatus Ryanbacteria bacterium RIFCSPHIGHO2_12_FULL_44_20]OGZ52096.1 MAG: hypothetical protein A3A17_01440 [Candidatus Ryanba